MFRVGVLVLGFLATSALACEYTEHKSPCCDEGFGLDNDVYLFNYYADDLKLVRYYHTGIKAFGSYYFHNSGKPVDNFIEALAQWKVGIPTPVPSCANDPNNNSYTFWKKTFIGRTTKTKAQFEDIMKNLIAEDYWKKYHVLLRNCNIFSKEVATRLGLKAEFEAVVPFKLPGYTLSIGKKR